MTTETKRQSSTRQRNTGRQTKTGIPKTSNSGDPSTKSKSMRHESSEDMITHPAIDGLTDRATYYLSSGYPVHFTGPTGVGKTSLAIHIAKKLKRPVLLIHGNPEMSNADLIGSVVGHSSRKVVDNYVRSVYKIEEQTEQKWRDGRLFEAVTNGYTVVYDEFTRSKPELNNLFLSILEEKILPLYGTGRKESYVKVHPNFSMIFTSNPEEYVGVYQSQDALLDRLITIDMEPMDNEVESLIVAKRTGVSEDEAGAIVKFVSALREKCADEEKQGPSLRASMMIAEITKQNDIPIGSDNEEFQTLCLDAVWLPVSRCLDKDKSDIRKLILQEVKKIPKVDKLKPEDDSKEGKSKDE